jgi:Gly-Xaa carboxypeptidase
MGIMIAIETMIEKGFSPTREVVLSFGFYEEASGVYGAHENAKALTNIYGENSFALILDEGGGFAELYGGIMYVWLPLVSGMALTTFRSAVPDIAEKGYFDVRVKVNTPGGHSSIPPLHTGIGILAHLLVKYEQNPVPARLKRGTPLYETVQCLAHAPGLPHKVKHAIGRSGKSDRALKVVEDALFKDPMLRALAGTTQAVDIVEGGVKSNALPEEAYAVVNHRIDTASSLREVMEHDGKLLMPLAKDFNLSVVAFGTRMTDADATSWGSLELSDAWGTGLEPAPVTPTDAKPYKLLAGTIKAVYAAHRADKLMVAEDGNPSLEGQSQDIIVAPGIMPGNTDTRWYWALSEHIIRYNHGNEVDVKTSGIHMVNESIRVDAFLEQIRFFNTLILNVDEADL